MRIFYTGKVCVSPYLPFGGDNCGIVKAAGLTTPKRDWLWLPVSAYLIEHPKGRILVDTGWNRDMSPNGVFDKAAQIRSLAWIRDQSLSRDCVESIANHDPDVAPHTIEL